MKKKILISVFALTTSSVFATEEILTLEQRVDQLETASYLQTIRWNGSFEYRYDSINNDNAGRKTSYTPMRLKVLLDASTHADQKIRFYTRFGLQKFTNDVINQGPETGTFNATRSEKGVTLKLERAYVNYSVTEDITASLGRLPTIDGPPTEMWDNSPRLGTYPLLAYGAILDGVALSYNWGFLPTNYKLSTRFIYTPIYNVARDSILLKNIAKPSYNGGSGPTLQEKATLYSVMADFETKVIPFLDNFNFIAQAVALKDLHLADAVPRGTDLGAVTANPALGGSGIPTATGVLFAGSNARFSLDALTANTTLSNIANTNISLGFTYLHTTVESKGSLESSAAVAAALNATADGRILASKLGVGKGLMTDSTNDRIQGSTTLTTLTYITPFSSIKNPLVGAEYLHGTKGVQYVSFAADDLTSFYTTRGNAYHVFWSQPLTPGVKVRIGYMLQDHKFTKGYVGAPQVSYLDENTIYGNFRYTF